MVECRVTRSVAACHDAWEVVSAVDRFYPALADWYWGKVVPGIVDGGDTLVLACDGDEAVGVALARKGPEPKLRCLRVVPRFAGRGLGIRLIDVALREIGCSRPLVSAAEEVLHDLSRIFVNRFGFELTGVEKGSYRPGKLEYVFNGSRDLPA